MPGIKRVMRKLTMDECFRLLKQVLESDSVTTNNKLVRERVFERFPEELMFYASMLEEPV
jgi:phosphotransferase system enzyme I (PtsI)